ncbi:MAG TPA: inositol monophosphatase family protein, partial [Gemmatimonadales bacterium]|nr:inositol monophosphatase family protein [Gemmatimonadales bacterium]
MSPADWLPFLTELADRADALSLRWFRSSELGVREKADSSPVTEADNAIETMARALARERHPELGVLGEEQGDVGATGARLIIDPIDGTRNFVRGIPVFATLLAIEISGEVVAGVASAPALRGRWRAARGAGAFRDDRRLRVSRTRSLADALVLHGNLGSAEGGPPPGIARLLT